MSIQIMIDGIVQRVMSSEAMNSEKNKSGCCTESW